MGDRARGARKFLRIAGDAIVKARAHGDQEVAILDRVIGGRHPVHAEHAHAQRVRGVDAADAHQGRDDRDVQGHGKLGQRRAKPRR